MLRVFGAHGNMDNKLQELIELCPCRVEIEYDYDYDGGYHIPSNTIILEGRLNKGQRFSVLTHELQHAECQQSNCICRKYKIGSFLREYHAYKSQIIRCLRNVSALRYSIIAVQKGRFFDGDFSGHAKACKKLMITKLWQKALKLLELS